MSKDRQPLDDEELEAVLAKFEDRARAITGSFRIPPEDGEDLFQEVLLIYTLKRDRIYSTEGWLAVTLRRQCIMYWRRRQRSLVSQVDEAILELMAPQSAAPQESATLRGDLERTLAKLPDRCRSVLQLRYQRELSPREVARSLGYRFSGIYKVLERCLSAFSQHLVENGFEEVRS